MPNAGLRGKESSSAKLSQRFDEGAFEEDTDQVTFVIGAALEVVNRIRRLGQGVSGLCKLLLDLRFGPGQQSIGFVRLRRYGADAADHRLRSLNILAINIEHQRQTQCRSFLQLVL